MKMWELMWQNQTDIQKIPPPRLPYSLDSPELLSWLQEKYAFGIQLCLPVYSKWGKRLFWNDLALKNNHVLEVGKDFWDSIGIHTSAGRVAFSEFLQEPYHGTIDLMTWQSLRLNLAIPTDGILYSDELLTSDGSACPDIELTVPGNSFRFFRYACVGERLVEPCSSDLGVSVCWRRDEWLLFVDAGLSRAGLFFSDQEVFRSITKDDEIETYLLWSTKFRGS
ncbi:hypothetical protein [Corynebacterium nasicanis]|uniref:Uncharacterized protein n=1 Tax=Corynebacterium nasicanis TaxID=1448267 RepID=A0ABW1QEV5_9CORY